MKTKNYLLILSTAVILFVSCGKDGATGPQGPQGSTGSTGAAGAVGPAGKDGSQMYAGTGAPLASLGNAGDYYLDQTADNLYGPKTTSGWGTPLSLKGATGAQGATGATGAAGVSGSKILSGSGTPATTTGNIGDYYLDVSSYLLYGPKTSSGWGGGLLLKGKDGNQFVNSYVFKKDTITLTGNSAADHGGSTNLTVPAITANIISQGAVLIYINYLAVNGFNDVWNLLPYTYNYMYSNGTSFYISVRTNGTYLGYVDLIYYSYDLSGYNNTPTKYFIADYKVVVIQGASVTQLAAANPNTNFKDYNQVASLFHLNK